MINIMKTESSERSWNIVTAVFAIVCSTIDASGQVPVSEAPPPSQDDIRFVVMADRTGGMIPGVYEDAIEKANLLHPEFVLSVGDLIDGYTLEPILLDAQWKEFDAMVEAIDMPFYYVPGNHDISNPWMEEEWRRRLGDPYYHFLYKDVLFLILHTEDGGKSGISREQGEYVRETLARYSDVRWTFLFMHRPLWSYEDQQGFEAIGDALEGRRYTLFSGHHHNYYYSPNNGNERLILGTSGGGSPLRGAAVGEFQHITHVVLTDEGPKIAHLALDGFVPKDVVNEDNREMVDTLRSGSFARFEPVVAPSESVERLSGRAVFENPAGSVLLVEGELPQVEGARFEPTSFSVEVAGGEAVEWEFALLPEGQGVLDLSQLDPISATVVGSYPLAERKLSLPADKLWAIDWHRNLNTVDSAPVLDGRFDEWGGANWHELSPPGGFDEGWDWRGPQDSSVRFAMVEDETNLYVALEVDDDRLLFLDGPLRDMFTLFFESEEGGTMEIDLRPDRDGTVKVVSDLTGVSAVGSLEQRVVRVEVAVSKSSLQLAPDESWLRFNLRFLDHDRPENQKPSRLYWKPKWKSAGDFEGSGLFKR